jgi:hypothetical protein
VFHIGSAATCACFTSLLRLHERVSHRFCDYLRVFHIGSAAT